MQLFEELPVLMAMFFCGFLGYMSIEWLKRRAAASAQHRQKLEGLCETKVTCTATATAATMNFLDPAACKETIKQPNHQQLNPRKKRQRNKKVARQACRAIHLLATHDAPLVACDVNMDSSTGTATTVSSDIPCLAENLPTADTSVADKSSASVMFEEMAIGSVQEHGNAPVDDGSVAGCECMTVNMDDAQTDDEAEAEAACATNIQKASADDHKEPQDSNSDADWLCQQPVLHPEQKPHIQGDGMEGSQRVMAHDKSEVQHVEEQGEDKKREEGQEMKAEMKPEQNKEGEENDKLQGKLNQETVGEIEKLEHGQQEVELLHAAPADEEKCGLHEPELGDWPETTDEGRASDHSSQTQQDDDHLSKEEQRRRVLTSDWAETEDEEDWSESGYDATHQRCLHALDQSEPQHVSSKQDIWSMPFANNQPPTPQLTDSCWPLDNDNWMTPFDPADGETPGWFTDDKWFGRGQSVRHGQQLENDCWMTPFDELIQQTTPHFVTSDASTAPSTNSPMGQAVCIWNAGSITVSEAGGCSPEGNGGEEIFTDGQQVFQAVPSETGQQLFTDGKQLFASVCVVVGPPGEAVDPTSATACDAALSSSPCSTVSFMADLSDDEEPSCAPFCGAED